MQKSQVRRRSKPARRSATRSAGLYPRGVDAFAEYERKFDAPSGFELPELDGEPIETRVFVSVYYDTDRLSLLRCGITLRHRLENGQGCWQLKLPQADDRLELSSDGLPDTPPLELTRLLAAHTRHDELRPVATLRTRRRGELVETERVSAEVTLDEVAVMESLQVSDEFVEIEVEVRSGDRKSIGPIIRKLKRAGARGGDNLPKLARALQLRPAEQKRKPSADASARLRAWLGQQLTDMLANDPGTRLGKDPDSLHDMRVAVRRTRAVLRAARRLIVTDTRSLLDELKWLGEALGSVRDLDVMLAHLHQEAVQLDSSDREAALTLLRTLERERDTANSGLLDTLNSERYLTLLDSYERTVAELEPAAQPPSLGSMQDRQLSKLRRSIRDLGDNPSDTDLHAQRKRGKRVRYLAELAGDASVAKRARKFQDVLGEHQDAVIAQQRLRRLGSAATPTEALAAGRLIEREHERKARARAEWPKSWKRLKRGS
jgi:CHAD domain-containing protein